MEHNPASESEMTIPEKANPLDVFESWLDEARQCEAVGSYNAMVLATVDADGMPWPRIVLLKDFDEHGFTFYTNLTSIKSRQLDAHPKASLCFFWKPLDKQVRILGTVEHLSDEEADAYFATRPRESQIGAWASKQSQSLPSRTILEDRFAETEKKYDGKPVPRPPFWSGFRLLPSLIEFWEQRPHRLHDRLAYTRDASGAWVSEWLYP